MVGQIDADESAVRVHRTMTSSEGKPSPDLEWWTSADVAAYLGVRASTVSTYRMRGQMPAPDEKIGRTQLWRPQTIIEWHSRRPGRGNWG